MILCEFSIVICGHVVFIDSQVFFDSFAEDVDDAPQNQQSKHETQTSSDDQNVDKVSTNFVETWLWHEIQNG